jgi:hypothetical protein
MPQLSQNFAPARKGAAQSGHARAVGCEVAGRPPPSGFAGRDSPADGGAGVFDIRGSFDISMIHLTRSGGFPA